jgi:carbamoyltransferase
MLFASQVHPARRGEVAAIVHVDGSARPQTVTRDQNEAIHGVITAFSRRTGVPLLMKTSFNSAGEPIVCTPSDAIRTFLRMGLDVLVLGPYAARRRGGANSAAAEGREIASLL